MRAGLEPISWGIDRLEAAVPEFGRFSTRPKHLSHTVVLVDIGLELKRRTTREQVLQQMHKLHSRARRFLRSELFSHWYIDRIG